MSQPCASVRLFSDAPCADITLMVVARVQRINAHAPPCAGSMHKLSVADVDAHMRDSASARAEKDQIAWAQFAAADRLAHAVLRGGVVRKSNAVLPIDMDVKPEQSNPRAPLAP